MHVQTMRPTPLDKLPQLEIHIHTGYVADELCESVKITYEFDVRLAFISYFL